ncbi:hypothetical protein [Burkholderia pyrrocinia]|uniref:hypothetical protein n=1 Tax=Burkholderia pyrrocinia TaxID=60550 RepID=UPI00158DA742|nr:hypothetical protein [Burkholderia pyrrocinia]
MAYRSSFAGHGEPVFDLQPRARSTGLSPADIRPATRAVLRDIDNLSLDMNRDRIHSLQETINRHPAIHLSGHTL